MAIENRSEKRPEYPQRPSAFFMAVIHLLSVETVARALGRNGLNLVRIIVTKEDLNKQPAFFTDDQLVPLMQVTDKPVKDARDRCVDAGWIHYEPGSPGKCSIAWVTVPRWVDEQFPDRAHRWRNSAEMEELRRRNSAEPSPESRRIERRNSAETSASYIPCPQSNVPPPLPPLSRATWAEVERIMIEELGIRETVKPLKSLESHDVDPVLAIDVLRHAIRAKLWRPGKVRRRLINLLPGQDPADTRLWMPPDFPPIAPAAQPPGEKSLADRDRRLRQLELEFGDELKSLTTAELIERYEPPASVRDALRPYPTYRAADRAPAVQVALLEFLSEMKKRKSEVSSK